MGQEILFVRSFPPGSQFSLKVPKDVPNCNRYPPPIMIFPNINSLDNFERDVCIVGAGPVGIALALELSRLGKTVLLLESGGPGVRNDVQSLSDAIIKDPSSHVPMNIAVQRRLGGTSNLWGGRCVPLDALDFEPRPVLKQSAWPIAATDLAPFLAKASKYLGCGEAVFTKEIPGLKTSSKDFLTDRLERWSSRPVMRTAHLAELRKSSRLALCLLATVVGFKFEGDDFLREISVRGPDGARAVIRARQVVLAAGGLENTRLLLEMQRDAPGRFGGPDGPLGRYYMGHLTGSIANIVIKSPVLDAGMDYFNDAQGYCLRRRFWPNPELQRRHRLTNVTLRTEFPSTYDPGHGNGVLSLAYLGLSFRPLSRHLVPEVVRQTHLGDGIPDRAAHWRNVAKDLPHIATFFPKYLYRRYVSRSRTHSFFERCSARLYRLRYHAEHLPNPDSRVTLSDERDAYGLRRLAVDFRYTVSDVEPIIRSHECFSEWLSASKLGTLQWTAAKEQRISQITSQARDGRHQIGSTRMGRTEKTAVVDKDCRVFGIDNLFVAGTSIFPTSGHANPTLTAVAFAMRLAQKLTDTSAADLPLATAPGGLRVVACNAR
jgi:choline dehydrogenase-like flavoprotein